jgi:hypothetical protein
VYRRQVFEFLLCVMLSVVDFKGLLSDDRLKCLVIIRERSKLDTLKIEIIKEF